MQMDADGCRIPGACVFFLDEHGVVTWYLVLHSEGANAMRRWTEVEAPGLGWYPDLGVENVVKGVVANQRKGI